MSEDLRAEHSPTPTSQWRQFTNYMNVANLHATRPEVARSRELAHDFKHRGRVSTPSPRPTNRATRRRDRQDPNTGRRIRGDRGTFTKDLGTWAAEQRKERAGTNAERRAFNGSVLT